MVFSSHIFLYYFLPMALVLWFAAPGPAQHLLLSLLSYVFYGWANPLFVPLMLCSTALDYVSGLVISGQTPAWGRSVSVSLPRDGRRTFRQKAALTITVMLNLSLLAFFKYFNFGVDSWNQLVQGLGWASAGLDTAFRVTLPLGISFWTFHAISYVVDVYRGDARAIRNYVDYSCYVGMFPQLVAGPIVRFQDVAEQLSDRTVSLEKIASGIVFFSIGLAKKILLANPCGQTADIAFDADSPGLLESWTGLLAYAFQIYFDFSGYSDMAIGLALIHGFQFVRNFNSPYQSQSITEFWRRWHISLSAWLRDYLYIPLGGNRGGALRTRMNLLLVMIIGGLWHGAAWTYVTWGALHGVLLCVERARGWNSLVNRFPEPVRVALTFLVVCLTWVVFRAHSIPHALRYFASLAGLTDPAAEGQLVTALIFRVDVYFSLTAAALVTWLAPQSWDFTRRITWPSALLAIGLLWASMAGLAIQSFNPFIYFMF